MFSQSDHHYMRVALSYANRGIGRTAPNPSVGCVIVKNNRVIAAARTSDGGRPHAEINALAMAADEAYGAIAYITLEPCSHEGISGSCAKALAAAGLKEVVVACTDPNPLVNGKGITLLEKAGIVVKFGLLEHQAQEQNSGFMYTQTINRPFITLKTAVSADGMVALPDNKQVWLTNTLAKTKAHQLRSHHDAIMCGIGTVTADDPLLTTRVNGLKHKAIRIVLDSNLSIDPASKLVQTASVEPLWIIHKASDLNKVDQLQKLGVKVIYHDTNDLIGILDILSKNGVTRLLVEGGPRLHHSFIISGLFDEIALFQSPVILHKGVTAFFDMRIENIKTALKLQVKERIKLSDNTLTIYSKV